MYTGDFPVWQALSWRGAFDKFGVSEWAMWVIRWAPVAKSPSLEHAHTKQQYMIAGCSACAGDAKAKASKATLQKSCEIVFALRESQSGRQDWVHATQFSSPRALRDQQQPLELNSVSDGCGTPTAIDFIPCTRRELRKSATTVHQDFREIAAAGCNSRHREISAKSGGLQFSLKGEVWWTDSGYLAWVAALHTLAENAAGCERWKMETQICMTTAN
jgi:hypothetical protein